MPTIDSRPDDRFKPGDVLIYQQAGPDDTTPRKSHRNGEIATVIGRYNRREYTGNSEAYQLQFENGGGQSAYYTKLCELAAPATIIGDDDSDCI